MRLRTVGLGVVPLILLIGAMFVLGPEHGGTNASQARAFEPSQHFRTVVFILDSAGNRRCSIRS
jgi:hypothetical protein